MNAQQIAHPIADVTMIRDRKGRDWIVIKHDVCSWGIMYHVQTQRGKIGFLRHEDVAEVNPLPKPRRPRTERPARRPYVSSATQALVDANID